MMNPFRIVWELIEFGIQALFVYVLAIILCVGLIAYVIADKKEQQPEIQYIYEKEVIGKVVEKLPKSLVCTRIEGCETFKDAKTPEEYCPTCEWR